MLRVENLRKSFDDFKAVDGASLAVDAGERVAVIGPNGAGKTTFFNLITGHLKPDQGRIIFNGEEISRLPAHAICRKGIARFFRSPTSSRGSRCSATSRSRCCPRNT